MHWMQARLWWLVVMLLGVVPAVGAAADPGFVPLPVIEDGRVAPRVVYIENPRFPRVDAQDLTQVLRSAADRVKAHFGVTLVLPRETVRLDIDDVFSGVVERKRPDFDALIGDFRNDRVDWARVQELVAQKVRQESDPLSAQIAFARPYLVRPPEAVTVDGFARAVVETFRARLYYWRDARLADGHPVIGRVPGRPDLPHNEYGYWALMAKLGLEAEIILTNQLVASVEYLPLPVHTSLRGGITGGSTHYNPSSRLGASVWVSLFPFLSGDAQIVALRGGHRYPRERALLYAGTMLAHELGHLLFRLGHPWSNPACLMRPAVALEFAAWHDGLDPAACPIGSSPAMQPGVVKAPVW